MKYKQRGGDRPKGLKMETPKQMRQMRRAARKRRKKMQDPKRLKQAGGDTGRKDGNPTGLNFMTDKQKVRPRRERLRKSLTLVRLETARSQKQSYRHPAFEGGGLQQARNGRKEAEEESTAWYGIGCRHVERR